MNRSSCCIAVLATFAAFTAFAGPASAQSKIEFNRDIRPILSDKCFACHGPDTTKLKGKLRLDLRDVAVKKGAIVPGKPDESELVRRIHATDGEERMPPPKSNKTLTAAEKDLLKRWIAAGADYKVHWAYVAPRLATLPAVKNMTWPRNPIDHFILARSRAGRAGAVVGSREDCADPPGHARFDRAATHSRGGGGVPGRR